MTTLVELEAEYQAFSKRGIGGRMALAGFDFQFALSLDRFFESALSIGPRAGFLFDSLTDVAERHEELDFYLQVKRTLTRAKLRDAWLEFLELDRFLEMRHPSLRNHARYRVICAVAAPGLRDHDSNGIDIEEDDADRWRGLRERYLGWEERSDPRATLVSRIWRSVRHPYAFVDSCHGILLNLLGRNVPSGDIADALLREYERARDPEILVGQPLSIADFRPDDTRPDRILTGERPNISDLNAGCFMTRHSYVRRVLERLEQARQDAAALRLAGKLQVVWIGGGSGVGKSALLLQVLRAWVSDFDVPAIYLRHFPKEIPSTIRRMGTADALIAVDDLYAPEARSSELWSEVSRLASAMTPTTILTCGPHDYYTSFCELAHREGTFEVQSVDVLPLGDAEGADYLGWYGERTGARSGNLPSRNLAIAAFLLERRRRGDPTFEAFAARLKQRLEQLEFITDFRAALALNRLGARMPLDFFKTHQDSLHRLESEALLMTAEKPGDDGVVWFHPQVASVLYKLWRPPSDSQQSQIEDLRLCFRGLRDYYPLCRAALRLFGKRRPDLTDSLRRDVVTAVWRDLLSEGPGHVEFGLLRECRAAGHSVGLDLISTVAEERVLQWLRSQTLEPKAWAATFCLFWDFLSDESRRMLATSGIRWLDGYGAISGWSGVWLCLWREETGRASPLTELALCWLHENSGAEGWTYVFRALVDAGQDGLKLLDAGRLWLAGGRPTRADLAIWKTIRGLGLDPNEAARLLVVCASRNSNPFTVEGILAQLRLESVACPDAVLDGLWAAREGNAWSFLFAALCKDDLWPTVRHRDRLFEIGRIWLVHGEARTSWAYVWSCLLKLRPHDRELLTMGRTWLGINGESPALTRIWLPLFRHYPRDEVVVQSGVSWLKRNGDNPIWPGVWRKMLEKNPDAVNVQDVGRCWLAGREELPSWPIVWQKLFRTHGMDAAFRSIGRAWLRAREESGAWAFVWEMLYDSSPEDVQLRAMGESWLVGREHRAEYRHILHRLVPGQWSPRPWVRGPAAFPSANGARIGAGHSGSVGAAASRHSRRSREHAGDRHAEAAWEFRRRKESLEGQWMDDEDDGG